MSEPLFLTACRWEEGGVVHADNCQCPESPWCPSGNHLLSEGGCAECSEEVSDVW